MTEPAKPSRMPISVGSLLWIALIVWLVMPSPRPTQRQVDELRSELRALRSEVGQLQELLAGSVVATSARQDANASAGSAATSAGQSVADDAARSAAPPDAGAGRAGSGPERAAGVAEDPEDVGVERE